MKELWRAVDGYCGYYEVSNTGLVRSVDRDIVKSNGVIQHRCGKLKKQTLDSDGYSVVKLSKDGVDISVPVHTLVATAFVSGYFEGAEVNHKDFNRTNNDASNLEWVTHHDNVLYSIRAGRHICTTDMSGCNNPNYNNHTLRDRYRGDPKLSAEKQGRPGSMNGRAKSVRLTYQDGSQYVFGTIKDCAQHMINEIGVNSKQSSLAITISRSIKRNTLCYGCVVEII